MSVEKLSDSSQTSVEENPYTQICNSVTEHIKDNDAYRLYCYLATKSREWTVIKEWTAKVCGVGERKAKQCWAYLERAGLIKYMTVRDETGKFVKHDIRVLNGTKFNPNEPFVKPSGAETAPVEKLSTDEGIHRCKNPPGGETTRVDFAPLLNKDNTNKDFDTKKRKSFCATAQKKPKSSKTKSEWREENNKRPDWADKMDNAAASKQQMDNEARHIAEHEAHKRAPMPDSLRNLVKSMRIAS